MRSVSFDECECVCLCVPCAHVNVLEKWTKFSLLTLNRRERARMHEYINILFKLVYEKSNECWALWIWNNDEIKIGIFFIDSLIFIDLTLKNWRITYRIIFLSHSHISSIVYIETANDRWFDSFITFKKIEEGNISFRSKKLVFWKTCFFHRSEKLFDTFNQMSLENPQKWPWKKSYRAGCEHLIGWRSLHSHQLHFFSEVPSETRYVFLYDPLEKTQWNETNLLQTVVVVWEWPFYWFNWETEDKNVCLCITNDINFGMH